jgi:V/A-type H+-transporting ATPase subunit A
MSGHEGETAFAVVRRVNGPLIEVDGLSRVAVADLLEVGPDRLPAEVMRVRPGSVTAQAFEYTGGLCPGDPVTGLGRRLSARLGPWLLGGVFDGLLRPLTGEPAWLRPGAVALGADARWRFQPVALEGQLGEPGMLIGLVERPGPLPHLVLVPPGVRGKVHDVASAGPYGPDDVLAVVGDVPVGLGSWWPVRHPRPVVTRLATSEPLLTGQRVIDAVFPIMKGGTAAVPGGFGTGKTVLLQQIAKWCDADVIVYVGCGERGNELADAVAELSELTDPRTGGKLTDRTVIIANTSNMPIMAREASIYTGVTVAEFFRDMGYHAVVIADSTSRWAEALREFASRTGAMPAEEGYPAGLASALAAFYERAGTVTTLSGKAGSVTVIGAVSPPGGDLTEPVTAHTQRFVRTLWTLDRELAYSRHYPAIGWAGSYCRDADAVAAWYVGAGESGWGARRARVIAILAEADRLAELAELVGIAALPGRERMVLLAGRLLREGVLQQSALSALDAHCTREKSAALIDLVLDVLAATTARAEAGVLASTIEALDFSPVLRAAQETGPAETSTVTARRQVMLDRIGEAS